MLISTEEIHQHILNCSCGSCLWPACPVGATCQDSSIPDVHTRACRCCWHVMLLWSCTTDTDSCRDQVPGSPQGDLAKGQVFSCGGRTRSITAHMLWADHSGKAQGCTEPVEDSPPSRCYCNQSSNPCWSADRAAHPALKTPWDVSPQPWRCVSHHHTCRELRNMSLPCAHSALRAPIISSQVSVRSPDAHSRAPSKAWFGETQSTSTRGTGQMLLWMMESTVEESVL